MEPTVSILFALLQSALRDLPLTDKEKAACTPERLEALYRLSQHHDVAHLLALGLQQNGICAEAPLSQALQKSLMLAVYRTQQQTADLAQLCALLEEAQIPFMPLKGSVLRKRYPEPWMRTSCDIDLLVTPEHLKAAKTRLEANGFVADGGCSHDVSFHSPRGTHVELHFQLLGEGFLPVPNLVLQNVWASAQPVEGRRYQMQMTDAYFYFYHITHMAKHFTRGGFGIRPVLDLWILNQEIPAGVDALLEQGQLSRFAQQATKLSRHWLECQPADEATLRLQHYILNGGIYGTLQNNLQLQRQQAGGWWKYTLRRIFPTLTTMRAQYPVLKHWGILLPVFYVVRWFQRICEGKLNRSVREVRLAGQHDDQELARLLQDVGL